MTIQTDAQAALTQSDKTILRCCDRGVMVPEEWVIYRSALRRIVSGTDPGPIPVAASSVGS